MNLLARAGYSLNCPPLGPVTITNHVTCTVPCAISFENDKKNKVPYEGRSRLSDRAGKTRTALLEMCTASQGTRTAKSMQINDRMQNPVFSKIVDESEHSESKFYYSGELFDAELLPSPTHSESTQMKKFTTLS